METMPERPWANARMIIILAALYLVYFVVFAAYAVYVPFFPSEAESKGVSSTVVGLIFGTYPFVVFIFSAVFGFLIPKYGARFVLLSGIFIGGGSLILFGFCDSLSDTTIFTVFCFLLRTTSAIGGAAAETSCMSILIEKFPNNVGAVTGAAETFTGIGFSLGPALGGFLYSAGGFKLPFIVMGCAMISTIPAIAALLQKQAVEETREESTSFFKALRIPGVFMSALSFVIIGCSFGYLEPIFEPHMKQLGENSAQIGLMFLLYSAVYAALAPAIGWLGDKTKWYRGFLILGFTGFGIGYLMLGPAPFLTFLPQRKVWFVCISLPICGLGGGFSFVPIMPDLVRSARANGMPDNSSTYAVLSSIFGCMFYLGATIGPSIAGIFSENFGFQWATSIAGFICFGQALLLSAFTMFEPAHRINDANSGLAEEEKRPILVSS
ncbi:unnamed protein product [Porites lobata]|uniref:Major facilitator superfamily (MFS) profile domain-containing protein n=1 Tax=Porites lobata TaxID=104759 RepID=A0ABN8NQC6_9CNID|nr:unnamed protein product [Porites lobata]